MPCTAERGKWYVDHVPASFGTGVDAFFKVLVVNPETLHVLDQFGVARTVSRVRFENDLEPARRVPLMEGV